MDSDHVLFQERQRFSQHWLWINLLLVGVVPAILIGFGAFQERVLVVPRSGPLANYPLGIVVAITLVIGV